MTPQESADLARRLRQDVVALRVSREADQVRVAQQMVADGVAEADAVWLTAWWTRKRLEVADALRNAEQACYELAGAAKEIQETAEKSRGKKAGE